MINVDKMTYQVFSTRSYSQRVGKVLLNGQVFDAQGVMVGKVYLDGKIQSGNGEFLGRAIRSGSFAGHSGASNYRMDLNGNIFHHNNQIGIVKEMERGIPQIFVQWAACLLLLDKKPDQVKQPEQFEFKQPEPSIMDTQVSLPADIVAMVRQAQKEAMQRRRI